MTTQIISFVLMLVFVIILSVIGFLTARKSKSMEGFLLGGRKIGPWLSAFAYGTSYFSAVILIGYAGNHGWNIGFASMWIGIGNALIGSALAWLILAKRTRRMTASLGARTMPEFFASRFDSNGLKIYSAIIIFVFLVPYAASVYKGLGSLFSTIFPIFGENGNLICMIIVALFTAVYLVLGGYLASAVNSLVQGIIMIVGVLVLAICVVNTPQVGGLSNAVEVLKSQNPDLLDVFGGASIGFLTVNIILTSLGTWGLPQMVQKFSALKTEKNVPQATIISTAFSLIIGCGAYFIGTFGRFFVPAAADGSPTMGGYDFVVPNMLFSAFGDSIWGSILIAVILVCVLSASMSTLSSVVLTSSSSISVDLLPALRKREIKEKKQILITRLLCLFFVLLSFIFATFNFAIIVSIMSYSWGIVAGCFIGPYLWGLYWKKTTRAGAWAGMISGFLSVAIMVTIGIITSPVLSEGVYAAFKAVSTNSPLFGCIAMGVSIVTVPIVSLFTKKPSEETLKKSFAINE